jgi:tetratricopeptide (TPR) repeat protein/tRNA A-37 threonylcarbamoyl transferase component Bud32
MPEETNAVLEREQRLDEAVTSYLEAAESGREPDPEEWLSRYPELTTELREFFADQDRVVRLTAPLRAVAQAAYGSTPRPGDTPPPASGIGIEAEPGSDFEVRSFSDYELLQEIGRGGMGIVYKARQLSLHRLVAPKMIPASRLASQADVQRFQAEAQSAASLDHPHIVPIYEVGELEGYPHFSMKLLSGGSLAQEVVSNQESGVNKEACRSAAQMVATVARAVHHAHQRGILHRDLKPSDILLDDAGQPHVTDFGLAKRVEMDGSITQSGVLVGTPSYMAPEQATGQKGSITTATDVYGLGAILYALLTGRPPFQASSVLETLEQVKTREPEPPARANACLGRDLETICLKCLEKEPSRRYSSADAVAEDLERWLAGEPIEARPSSPRERLWRWCRRNPKVAILTGVSTLLLLLVAAGSTVATLLIWREKEQTATALGVAQTNAERADANLRHALDALEKIYLQIDEKQWPAQPQFDRPDRALLEQMLQFYEEFARENSADPAVKRETAKAYKRVADIHQNLRHWPEAKEAYSRAITFLRQLAEEQPEDTSVWGNLAKRYHDLASVLDRTGPPQEAEHAYREAIAVYEKLVRADGSPEVFRYRGELAECLYNLGTHLRNHGQAAEAQASYRRATDLVEKLQKETPSDPDALHQLGIALQLWAEIRIDAHEYAEARPLLEQAIRHQQAAVQAKPGQVAYLTWLANHYEFLVRVLNFLHRPAAAEEALRQQVALGEQRVKALPDVPGYRYQLANSYTVLALHLHAAGRSDEAERIYRQALEINRDLAAKYPNKQFCQRHLGLSYHLLGALYRDMGKPEEAEQLHRQGLIAMGQKPSSYQERADFQIAVCGVLGLSLRTSFPRRAQPGVPLPGASHTVPGRRSEGETEPPALSAGVAMSP